MKIIIAGIFISLLLLTGCTHTRSIVQDQTPTEFFQNINKTLSDEDEIYVYLIDSTKYTASQVYITPYKCKFIEKESFKYYTFPTDTITHIDYKNYTAGFFEGALIGPFAGAGAGIAFGLLAYGGSGGSLVVPFGLALGGLLGSAVGPVYGVLTGATNSYKIPHIHDRSTEKQTIKYNK